MPPGIIVTGIPVIDRKLKRIGKAGPKIVRKSMRTGMKTVAQEMKVQAPVATGLTRSKIVVRAIKSKSRSKFGVEVRVNPAPGLYKMGQKGAVFYPATVQFGRHGVAPNPFGTRAFNAKGESARQTTLRELKDGVEAEARR